jgi:hypothetical protein
MGIGKILFGIIERRCCGCYVEAGEEGRKFVKG